MDDLRQRYLDALALIELGVPVTTACARSGLSRGTFYWLKAKSAPAPGTSAGQEPTPQHGAAGSDDDSTRAEFGRPMPGGTNEVTIDVNRTTA